MKSVIQGMFVYNFHVYAWPISLIKTVDYWVRNFIWSGDISTRKIVTVAWSTVCNPLAVGGLGIRPLRSINDVVLIKLCWQLLASEEQWASFCRARFIRARISISHYVCSSILPGIHKFINTVRENASWNLGDGIKINFWNDKRLSNSVANILSILDQLRGGLTSTVWDFICHGNWNIPQVLRTNFPDLCSEIQQVIIPQFITHDHFVWVSSDSGK